MDPGARVDRRFIARVTLIVAIPFTSVFTWAYFYGGQQEKWPVLVVAVLVTFLVALVIALGTWYFLVRPKQGVGKGIPEWSGGRMEPETGDAIEYLAHYSESNTRISERAFVRRGFRELWLLETVLGPVSAAWALVIGYQAGARSGFLVAFGALGCFLIALPAILLVARPALAAAGAKRRPSEVIAFRPEGLVVSGDAYERLYEWRRIRRVWDVGPHYVLVGDRHLGIHLPKDGLPATALDYVRSRAGIS